MPRHHQHVPGTAYRRNYSLDKLEITLESVIIGGLSFSQAAERFGIPKTTIWRKYKGLNSDRLGKSPVLNPTEERKIVEALETAASYGYPFTTDELRKFVQRYLNGKGVTVKCFTDNLPGTEWCKTFLLRNPGLSRRNCENMKRAKAKLSREILSDYFRHLQKTLTDVPPENILNYDETNISDDPGKVKVIVKKGTKHPSRIMDSSKSSNSVMFAIFADGRMLPPYVVHKAKNLYPEWIENGPDGARYNRSKNGWFDSMIFEDWFIKIALPALKKCQGKKVIIGGNLSSHLSLKIISLCQENEISFTFLPTNSTHVCQPLDVAVFGPLKKAWRNTLTKWKTKNKAVVPKSMFPTLLKDPLNSMQHSLTKNIKAGFESAGIVPLSPDRVMRKLLNQVDEHHNDDFQENVFVNSFESIIQEKTKVQETKRPKRGKKCEVLAGKSVGVGDLTSTEPIAGCSTSACINNGNCFEEVSDEEFNDVTGNPDNESEESDSGSRMQSFTKMTKNVIKRAVKIDEPLTTKMFVIVGLVYNQNTKRETLEKIIDKENDNFRVSFLRNYKGKKNVFIFPDIEDVCEINREQIRYIISQPVVRRGIHTFENDIFD